MKGIDVSFSRVSPVWCQKRVSEGYRVFVACLWTGGYQSKPGIMAVSEANLRDAREAGMITAGYLNTNPWWPASTSLNEAKLAAGAEWEKIPIVFNDVEIPAVTEAQIKAHCEAITGAGKRTAIYSARWFWTGPYMGNPQWPWLKDYKIWNAYYDGDPDIDFGKAPWGPWTVADVIGEQYGGTDIEGVTVDWNTFDEAFFAPQAPQSEEENEMFRITIPSGGQYLITGDGYKVPVTQVQAGVYDRAGVPAVPVSDAEAGDFPNVYTGTGNVTYKVTGTATPE